MRRLITPLLLAFTLVTVAYLALPFLTALQLKRAIRTGDVATVERAVDWPSVRASLRDSLSEQMPGETSRRFGRIPILGKIADKISARYGASLIDKMVASYGTAEGLVELASWKQELDVRRGIVKPKHLGGIAAEFAQRLRRVSFTSLTRLEVELADRTEPLRRFVGAMELREEGWKLTEVRILRVVE
jgi:hypothetical protein